MFMLFRFNRTAFLMASCSCCFAMVHAHFVSLWPDSAEPEWTASGAVKVELRSAAPEHCSVHGVISMRCNNIYIIKKCSALKSSDIFKSCSATGQFFGPCRRRSGVFGVHYCQRNNYLCLLQLFVFHVQLFILFFISVPDIMFVKW